MKKRIIFIISIILLQNTVFCQQKSSTWQQFKHLSCPEKRWVIFHPCIAKKTWQITQFVRNTTDSLKINSLLDGDANGGQLDAFRHAYWMALITKQFGWRAAYSLGKAHEKGNYLDYKKHRLEEGSLPDKASGDMDLWNNSCGINIGRMYKPVSDDSLKIIVIQNIMLGKMKIIRKDQKGQFLDNNFQVIPSDSIKGSWENNKVLDFSNFR